MYNKVNLIPWLTVVHRADSEILRSCSTNIQCTCSWQVYTTADILTDQAKHSHACTTYKVKYSHLNPWSNASKLEISCPTTHFWNRCIPCAVNWKLVLGVQLTFIHFFLNFWTSQPYKMVPYSLKLRSNSTVYM